MCFLSELAEVVLLFLIGGLGVVVEADILRHSAAKDIFNLLLGPGWVHMKKDATVTL
jgi:hypothetical protein